MPFRSAFGRTPNFERHTELPPDCAEKVGGALRWNAEQRLNQAPPEQVLHDFGAEAMLLDTKLRGMEILVRRRSGTVVRNYTDDSVHHRVGFWDTGVEPGAVRIDAFTRRMGEVDSCTSLSLNEVYDVAWINQPYPEAPLKEHERYRMLEELESLIRISPAAHADSVENTLPWLISWVDRATRGQ